MVAAYRIASELYRQGQFTVGFPDNMFRPWVPPDAEFIASAPSPA